MSTVTEHSNLFMDTWKHTDRNRLWFLLIKFKFQRKKYVTSHTFYYLRARRCIVASRAGTEWKQHTVTQL